MQRVGDIRINWPTVMSYNLLLELICGSLSMESRMFNVRTGDHGIGMEGRVSEMKCMVEFNCTSTNLE